MSDTKEALRLFPTAYDEKEFSKYDWLSLEQQGSDKASGALQKLCDELKAAIIGHNNNESFSSHSKLQSILNRLFCARLSWNAFVLDVHLFT